MARQVERCPASDDPGNVRDPSSLLLVDEDSGSLERLRRSLESLGFKVTPSSDAREAEQAARREVFAYALVDVGLAGCDSLLSTLRRAEQRPRIVALATEEHIRAGLAAVRNGAFACVTKPVDAERCAILLRAPLPASREPLSVVPKERVTRAVAACGGSVSEAARRLQLHPRVLWQILGRPPRD